MCIVRCRVSHTIRFAMRHPAQAKHMAKHIATADRQIAMTELVIDVVNAKQPHLNAVLGDAASSLCTRAHTPGHALTDAMKQHHLDIAFDSSRCTRHLCRQYKVGVMTVHNSVLASAAVLMQLQTGSILLHTICDSIYDLRSTTSISLWNMPMAMRISQHDTLHIHITDM